MPTLGAALRSIEEINDWIGKIISSFVMIIFVILLVEVIRRYVFNSPTVWGNELSQLFFGTFAVLCGGYIHRWDGHVRVDIIYSHLPQKTKALVDIVTSPLFFLFSGVLLYYGGSMALESLAIWEHSESAWNPPIYPIKMMIPAGALLLGLQGLVKLIRDIMTLVSGGQSVADETEGKGSA